MKYYIKSVMLALVVLAVVIVPTSRVQAMTITEQIIALQQQLAVLLSQVGNNNVEDTTTDGIRVDLISSSANFNDSSKTGDFLIKYKITSLNKDIIVYNGCVYQGHQDLAVMAKYKLFFALDSSPSFSSYCISRDSSGSESVNKKTIRAGNSADFTLNVVLEVEGTNQLENETVYAKLTQLEYTIEDNNLVQFYSLDDRFATIPLLINTPSNPAISGVYVDSLSDNTWYHDESKNIYWTSVNFSGNVDILLCNNDKCWPQKTNVSSDSGKTPVLVKLYAFDKRLGSDYYIKVRKVGDEKVSAKSSTFSIGNQSIYDISGITGYLPGDSSISNRWPHGVTKTITWKSKGLDGQNVDIILCNNDKCWPFSKTSMNIPNDGSETLSIWTLDKRLGTDYYIKIRRYNTEAVSGKSSTFDAGSATVSASAGNNTASALLGFQEVLQKISELVKR